MHEWTGPTGCKFRDVREPSGTYYRDTTPRAVVDGLERARESGARVRFWLGDNVTGRDWLEENDVCGRVGRSMGPIKIPLLISGRDIGGPAILTDCIVCLHVGGCEVYRHPAFAFPVCDIRNEPTAARPFMVYAQGVAHAGFVTRAKAERWVAFMRGERGAK